VLRGISGRASGSLALVPSGGKFPERCCSLLLNREDAPLGTDERTQSVTDLHVQIVGEDGLDVSVDAPRQLEAHTYAHDAGPLAADGHHILNCWVARVPVTLMPSKPWDIGGNRYPLNVTATYQIAPGMETHKFNARAAIEAEVSSAIYEMGAVSSVLPLLCLGAAFTRWRRTR
jgi:hypothetical protein